MHNPYKSVYSFDVASGIYTGETLAYLDDRASSAAKAVYICPPNATETPLPSPAGRYQAWFWYSGEWVLGPDFSQAVVWRIEDGQPGSPPPAGEKLPKNLTIKEPPELEPKQVRRWNAEADDWEITADHRGEIWYATDTGRPIPIESIELPDNVTDAARPSPYHIWKGGKWTLTLDGKRDLLAQQVADKRYQIETGGLTLPNGMMVGTDRADQAVITSAVSATQFGIKEYDWKGADGVWIKLSAEQIAQIGAVVSAHVQACFTAERKHSEAIAKLKTSKELDSYNVNDGWPSGMEG